METLHLAWEDIYTSSLKFLVPLTPQQTFKTVVAESIKLLNADEGTVIIFKNNKLVRMYASFEVIKQYDVSPYGRTYMALLTGEPFVSHIKSEKDIQPKLYKMGFKTIIFIPFSYGVKTRGVLNIFTKEKKRIAKKEVLKLKLFGTMISEALYKAEQYKKTENAILARDLLISTASHELKNPLTSIIMAAQIIKKNCEEKKDTNIQIVNNLLTQSLWLSEMINEILETKQSRSGKSFQDETKVQISKVIDLALTTFKASHRDYTVILVNNIKKNTIVSADFYKLLQVYINILNNAAKYSNRDQPITLFLEQREDSVVTLIADRGVGIAKKDIPKVFGGYYQGHKKHSNGMGLGLFLVKQIVDNAGGDISLQSEQGYGTTVTISLPLYSKS